MYSYAPEDAHPLYPMPDIVDEHVEWILSMEESGYADEQDRIAARNIADRGEALSRLFELGRAQLKDFQS